MDVCKVKQELIEQKVTSFKENIYDWTQVNFAYNSNKIESNRLSPEQTEMIFETNSLIVKSEESIQIDDLIETSNHFKLFDYMLDRVEDSLSKEMMTPAMKPIHATMWVDSKS